MKSRKPNTLTKNKRLPPRKNKVLNSRNGWYIISTHPSASKSTNAVSDIVADGVELGKEVERIDHGRGIRIVS